MVTAIILIQARRDRIQEVAQELLAIDGIAEVYSVAGRWDLVAIARVARDADLAEVATGPVGRVEGIERTETLIAFRAMSRYDLERMFAIGLD